MSMKREDDSGPPRGLLTGDCRDLLPTIEAGSVQCCVTSPPYFGLRDYGNESQIGLESTPEQFVDDLVAVFRLVRDALADDGTLWLNLGDTYSRSPKKGGSGKGGKNQHAWRYGDAQAARAGSSDGRVGRAEAPAMRSGGLAPKQLTGIPWRVAFALQEEGWYLRQDIIWHKPNPMPESVRDRCTKAHEYVFLLSKSPQYHFDAAAVSEPASYPERAGGKPEKYHDQAQVDPRHRTAAGLHNIGPRKTRNRRSVWSVATQPFSGAHFATMPPKLAELCVLAGSRPGDLVLDPFAGAGTTLMVAKQNGRRGLGFELNPEYVSIAKARIAEATAQQRLFK